MFCRSLFVLSITFSDCPYRTNRQNGQETCVQGISYKNLEVILKSRVGIVWRYHRDNRKTWSKGQTMIYKTLHRKLKIQVSLQLTILTYLHTQGVVYKKPFLKKNKFLMQYLEFCFGLFYFNLEFTFFSKICKSSQLCSRNQLHKPWGNIKITCRNSLEIP
jgi:hypothetical protein